MIGLLFSLLSIALLIFLLYKKVNAQMSLLLSGIVLLIFSLVFQSPLVVNFLQINGLDFLILQEKPILSEKQSLHFGLFDLFQVINTKMSSTLSGLGLTLMAIAGFSAYMDHVGASYALFKVFEKPLKSIKSPYVLLILSFVITQFIVIFIPSHAGLALLLMVMMYPILVRSGVSKLSALSVIGTCQFIDHGPGSGNVILAAQTANIDPATYFVYHQLPTTIPILIAVAVTNFFVQRYFDKKEGFVFNAELVEKELSENDSSVRNVPKMYAILPIIPLILILGFSKIFGSQIQMNVPVAMLISTFIAIFFEIIYRKSVFEPLDSIMIFFKGMGNLFVITVSLIVCGQVFATGLTSVGFVDALIDYAKNFGFNAIAIIIFVSILLAVSAFLMGSGNAAFFSFAPLIPNIAKSFGIDTITMIAPIQIMTGFGRCVSPIAPAIIAVATMAKVSPLQVVKRTAIPMLVAGIVNLICTYIYI
ncbi:C4-dicarboxylate transporter DcuD [[Pasteurella] mairii]|uniref:C4-dicarboxylate transporter DcuD n=1 Tax=[Pasteurella] mairii TaxID=757 RepID=A0A379B7X9_9PAST|nr:C4-dicarboxylate transporter DcuD [[Pasteurella] mairii]